jgi:sulfur carrier protein
VVDVENSLHILKKLYEYRWTVISGMFMKPAHKSTKYPMKLILSEKDVRILDHCPAPADQILLEQGINPLEVILSRNGKLVSEDTIIESGDVVRVIRIAHGG